MKSSWNPVVNSTNRVAGETIEIEIGIAIEIENSCNTYLFDSDFDSDFDPEESSSEAYKAKIMALSC